MAAIADQALRHNQDSQDRLDIKTEQPKILDPKPRIENELVAEVKPKQINEKSSAISPAAKKIAVAKTPENIIISPKKVDAREARREPTTLKTLRTVPSKTTPTVEAKPTKPAVVGLTAPRLAVPERKRSTSYSAPELSEIATIFADSPNPDEINPQAVSTEAKTPTDHSMESEDDSWLEEPALYGFAEAEPLELGLEVESDLLAEETKATGEASQLTITEQVVETTAVSPEIAEQATTLLVTLPEQVQSSLKEYIARSDPEVTEAIEAQIIIISKVADRLHELATAGAGSAAEVAAIEEWLADQYAELLDTLGVEYDQETIRAFLALVKSEDYAINAEIVDDEEPYDPMRERLTRQDLAASDQDDASSLVRLVHQKVAKLMVYHSQAIAA